MRLIRDYMRDDSLRRELNELTLRVFGFHFEDWYAAGHFEGDYLPYSFEENGQLLANASANRMEFLQNGEIRRYIQIGTVMTHPDHRNHGYARALIERILADFREQCDGFYLFANLSALGFYDKLGFSRATQYRYELTENMRRALQSVRPDPDGGFSPADPTVHRQRYRQAVRGGAAYASLEQLNRYSLQMFYTADMENVYYAPALDCYAVMEQAGGTLHLQSVVAPQKLPLTRVISHISAKYDRLICGFTPCAEDADLFSAAPCDGELDYRLFVLGDALRSVEAEKLYFPKLSHA